MINGNQISAGQSAEPFTPAAQTMIYGPPVPSMTVVMVPTGYPPQAAGVYYAPMMPVMPMTMITYPQATMTPPPVVTLDQPPTAASPGVQAPAEKAAVANAPVEDAPQTPATVSNDLTERPQPAITMPPSVRLPAPSALVAPRNVTSRSAPAAEIPPRESRLTLLFTLYKRDKDKIAGFRAGIADFISKKIYTNEQLGQLPCDDTKIYFATLESLMKHSEILQLTFTSTELITLASMRGGNHNIDALAKYDQAARAQDRRISAQSIMALFAEHENSPIRAREEISVMKYVGETGINENYLTPLSNRQIYQKALT